MNNQLQITELTSQCVMCGLCLPHCPTYKVTQDENESPRGRISLVQALALGQLDCETKVIQHLDNCLQCLSCEKVCPSQVEYGQIIHHGQQIAFKSIATERTLSLSENLLTNSRLKAWYLRLFNFLAKTKMLPILLSMGKKLSIRSSYYLPESPFAIAPRIQQQMKMQDNFQNVNIFTGCGNSLFDPHLVTDLIPLLKQMGLLINEINSDSCCGAIFQRKGDIDSLNKHKKANQVLYSSSPIPLLSLTSTCSAQLLNDVNNCYDICSYIAKKEYSRFQTLRFKPLPAKVIVHAACSLRNQLQEPDYPHQLLSHIPNMQLIEILSNGCCGAAGNYMLEHVDMADKIVEPYINDIINSEAKILLTTNIGCGLHIRAQLEKMNYTLEVKHPISLLSEQLII